MIVKFVPVRIGNFRQDLIKEKILKENYLLLRNQLREFIQHQVGETEIEMDIVIPKRGYRITFTLVGINNKEIEKRLKQKFPNSIYKGDYSIILESMDNKIFDIL